MKNGYFTDLTVGHQKYRRSDNAWWLTVAIIIFRAGRNTPAFGCYGKLGV